MNVAISHCDSYKAIGIAKFLKRGYSDLRIVGLVKGATVPAIHSRYFDEIYPFADLESAAQLVLELNRKGIIDILFPLRNSEMDFWLRNKANFGDILSYWGDLDVFGQLNDKASLHRIASSLSIKMPLTYSWAETPKSKVVLKPRTGSSAKGVKYIASDRELAKWRSAIVTHSDYLLEEYIQGTAVGYSCYCREGQIVVGFGHERLAEYPVSGGSSVYRKENNDPRLRETAGRLLSSVKWSGFAMVEFKLTSQNQLYLLEVNPRIWGSINQGLMNGINYFEPLLGTPTHYQKADPLPTYTYLSPLIYLSILGYMKELHFGPFLNFMKNIGKNRADVSLFDDPKGWLSLVVRKV